MDANGWAIIIGAIFLGLAQLLAMLLSYLRDRHAAEKVEQVRQRLVITDASHTEKLDDVAKKVEVVHKATNSLKDELVAATDKMARAEGIAEGRAAGKEESEKGFRDGIDEARRQADGKGAP